MASIRQIAQDILPETRDGIAWIALYEGRTQLERRVLLGAVR